MLRQVVKQAVKIQVAVALLVAVVTFLIAGWRGAASALAGSATVWVGLTLALLSMRQANRALNKTSAGIALMVMLRAEAIKVISIAGILWVIFKVYASSLVPIALIAGLAFAALLSGVGLMRETKTNNGNS